MRLSTLCQARPLFWCYPENDQENVHNELSQLERYTVQPEFDGLSWTDVVRVMVSPDWAPMPMRMTVYLAGGG